MPVDMNELGGWAAETETQQGQGILTSSGKWAVNMMSVQNTDAANNLQQVLSAAGFAAEIQEVQINDQSWLRIRIEGFVTRQDASSFANTINNQYGIQQPWVVKF
jgi:cell division septation protein DedD